MALDIAEPFPVTDLDNRLVIKDYFNKWPGAFAILNQKAATVTKVLVIERISTTRGRLQPRKILQIGCVSKAMRTAWNHNPQSDGMVERYNVPLKENLKTYINDHQTN